MPANAEWQPVGDITAAAETFLSHNIGQQPGATSVAADYFDSRHKLARCSEPLQGFLRRGTEIRARTIVGVRCTGPKPWKVYVPVNVIVTRAIAVAADNLPRSHVLTKADLRFESRDVSRLRSGYIGNADTAVGRRLRAPLLAGSVITPAMLEVDAVVRRGQTVTLSAGQGRFAINMSGIALMDGALNQRIRVENASSGRVVEGIVRSPERVEILLAGTPDKHHSEAKASRYSADTATSNNDR